MKNSIKLALTAVMLLSSTSVFATNGSNLIATGSTARAMGGVGIGTAHGAESALANVALMSSVEANEVAFGGMFFMPDVSNTNSIDLTAYGLANESGTGSSVADLNVIPEVSIASKMTEHIHLGIGIWGTAGMGVDYRDSKNKGQLNMVTNLQLMQFALPVTYTKGGLSVGFTPLLQYGSLDINYNLSVDIQKAMIAGSMQAQGVTDMNLIGAEMAKVTAVRNVGAGVGQDLKFGYNVGVAYRFRGLTLGAMYKSQIDMKYKGVLTTTVGGMVPGYSNDKLSTPEEAGVGVSYTYNGHVVGVDYKYINWDKAKGYQDFDWSDQKILAIGYEYKAKTWGLRAGYNYATSPISEQSITSTNSAGLSGGVSNTFNALGFPGVIERHYTFGGEVKVRKYTSMAFAVVYAPKVTKTFKNFLGQDITVEHGQTSLSFDVKYAF
jgi:long-chain fatty acid transport protein